MSTMQRYPFTLAPNGVAIIPCMGTRFNVLTATGAINVDLDVGGRLAGIVAGQGYKGREFTGLTLTDVSGGANSGFIQVSDDDFVNNVFSAQATITSNVVPKSSAYTSVQATVTNASATLLAANANRQALIIQNNDLTGDIVINLAGAAATLVNGIKIGPGNSISGADLLTMPTGIITAIGSIASNANVVVVEG